MSNLGVLLTSEKTEELLRTRKGRIHFVGILGAGMLPLAKLCASFGLSVSGSDSRAESEMTVDGLAVYPHRHGLVVGADMLVVSFAIPEDSPELIDARTYEIPIISRAELLGRVMRGYERRIGISGSHGKSTTTALIDKMLYMGGVSPTTVSGATLFDEKNLRIGASDVFVYEACEYRDAFLSFYPTWQIITGVELDHTDYFTDIEAIRASFIRAAQRAESGVILNADFDGAADFSERLTVPVITYGRAENADYRYVITKSAEKYQELCIYKKQGVLLSAKTSLIGEYNVANITAATALADTLGISPEVIAASISDFCGIERRLSRIGKLGDSEIFYDYAHHPTEILCVIKALKERYNSCAVVFVPHTYSRTKALWNDFISALRQADFTILLDIYPAREDPIVGVTSSNLAMSIGPTAIYASPEAALYRLTDGEYRAVVLMGAGDMSRLLDLIERSEGFTHRGTKKDL